VISAAFSVSEGDGRCERVNQRRDIRSFGRRRARKLTDRQDTLLEALYPRVCAVARVEPVSGEADEVRVELAADLVRGSAPVWLEIGFGGGEHLVWQARHNPHVTLIGCEPFIDGLVKVLSEIDTEALENIRLYDDDVRPLLRALPDGSLDRAFILFPDPWPKRRHVKRRLINPELLHELARAMKAGAELRIGTDIADYARTILLALEHVPELTWIADGPDDWRVRPSDWPQTRYEAKAVREGRRSCYFRIIKRV
jgi:tRNA (guanine-N7-)-methyltransferase